MTIVKEMGAASLLRAKQAAREAAANSEAAAKKLAEDRDNFLFAPIVEMYEELRKAGVKVRQEAFLAKNAQAILENKYSAPLPAPSGRLIEVRAVKYPSGYGTEITVTLWVKDEVLFLKAVRGSREKATERRFESGNQLQAFNAFLDTLLADNLIAIPE